MIVLRNKLYSDPYKEEREYWTEYDPEKYPWRHSRKRKKSPWNKYDPKNPTKQQLEDLSKLDSKEFHEDIKRAKHGVGKGLGTVGGIIGAPIGLIAGALKKKPGKGLLIGTAAGYGLGYLGGRAMMGSFEREASREGQRAKEKLNKD